MGEWCANFKGYDVQATRRAAREDGLKEGREEGLKQGIEEGIAKFVKAVAGLGIEKSVVCEQLIKQYVLEESEAKEKIKKYWPG